jgi:hypothetical protein
MDSFFRNHRFMCLSGRYRVRDAGRNTIRCEYCKIFANNLRNVERAKKRNDWDRAAGTWSNAPQVHIDLLKIVVEECRCKLYLIKYVLSERLPWINHKINKRFVYLCHSSSNSSVYMYWRGNHNKHGCWCGNNLNTKPFRYWRYSW